MSIVVKPQNLVPTKLNDFKVVLALILCLFQMPVPIHPHRAKLRDGDEPVPHRFTVPEQRTLQLP